MLIANYAQKIIKLQSCMCQNLKKVWLKLGK